MAQSLGLGYVSGMAKKKTTSRKKIGTNGGREVKFTPVKKAEFLEMYSKTGLHNLSARACAVSPETVRRHLKDDPDFAKEYDEVKRDFVDTIESEAYRRAVEGVLEPVFQGKEHVGNKRVFSDRMLELLLKRHVPEYREKQTVDMNVKGGILIAPLSGEDAKEWERRHREEDD